MSRGKAIPRTLRKKQTRNRTLRPASDRSFEAKTRSFRTIAKMRHDGLSLVKASREEGTTPGTVRRHLPAALQKSKTGRWVATKSDRYVRIVSLPGPHGPITERAHGSKEAQFASAYLASLGRWARTGKAYEVAPFRGKKVGNFELITNPRTLRALSDAGLLQLDSLYAALKENA
jgi:hypothetical protein